MRWDFTLIGNLKAERRSNSVESMKYPDRICTWLNDWCKRNSSISIDFLSVSFGEVPVNAHDDNGMKWIVNETKKILGYYSPGDDGLRSVFVKESRGDRSNRERERSGVPEERQETNDHTRPPPVYISILSENVPSNSKISTDTNRRRKRERGGKRTDRCRQLVTWRITAMAMSIPWQVLNGGVMKRISVLHIEHGNLKSLRGDLQIDALRHEMNGFVHTSFLLELCDREDRCQSQTRCISKWWKQRERRTTRAKGIV